MVYVTHDQEEAASMANRIALMQNGSVIQTDSPQELYRHPKTNFAAEFFGRANIISGTLTDLSADKATLVFKETAITVSTDKEKAVETGSPASVVIRPENIRISTIRPEQGNVLSGTVVSHEFNGASINSIIDVNGLHISVMSFSSETLPDKSSRVYISFNAQDAHCIPQTGAEN
jgi:ABC-type Fe3+/spermidine/putrescine transport system ATPase subunit